MQLLDLRALRLPALESAGGGGAALTQKRNLSTYLWRDADGGTQFCPTCGTAMMRTGYRDRISVNARCVEGIDIFTLKVARYDGRNQMPPGPTL
jgi:hypothetical protein